MSKLLEQINNEKRTPLLFSDYMKIKHGFAFKGEYFSTQPTSDILVTPGNFAIGGGFKSDKFKYYKGSIPEDYILSTGDLIVTMTDLSVDADTLGYSALVPKDETKKFLHNQRVGLVQKKKEGIDFGYLYYLMRTREYQKYVVSTASGSTVKHTSPDKITSYEYEFPSILTQKKIASILSAYDAKTENNNKIIKNLEATAQTIFNEWFVNFKFPGYEKVKMVESEMGEIPEGWEVKKIDDFCKTYGGGTPSTKEASYWEKGNIPWVTPTDMSSLSSIFVDDTTKKITDDGLKNSSARLLPSNSILMTSRATVGIMAISKIPITSNQGFVASVCDTVAETFYFFWWLKSNVPLVKGLATGSTFPEISRGVFRNIQLIVPEVGILTLFEKNVFSLHDHIYLLHKENISLKSQRDQLLAKLI